MKLFMRRFHASIAWSSGCTIFFRRSILIVPYIHVRTMSPRRCHSGLIEGDTFELSVGIICSSTRWALQWSLKRVHQILKWVPFSSSCMGTQFYMLVIKIAGWSFGDAMEERLNRRPSKREGEKLGFIEEKGLSSLMP